MTKNRACADESRPSEACKTLRSSSQSHLGVREYGKQDGVHVCSLPVKAGLPRGLLPSRGGGDDEREVESAHLVYLGLAAAAFLLLTLYPDAAPAGGGSPKAALPLACSGALSASGERPGAVQLPDFYPRRLFAVLRW